ncbi:hypothetical protein D0Z07_0899 [Hyphodiscus hymeniophilus]|uniref:Uncharacterized protein n=1 Tax=Hyphodiscus hymeniophilus TaxID=353542 RepID=A0A9P6VPN4_9HELO|nr:hypothetical protein D0Z07_0899 [Hyphodiscus hymeniophilus]
MIRAITNVTHTITGSSPSKQNTANMSASSITLSEFRDALSRYPALIKSISKTPTEGKATLEELDRFRYIDAPSRFSKKVVGKKEMYLADVQKLTDWKLAHGKFRPTLPKLVAKNSDEAIKEATGDAFSHYAGNSTDISGTLKKISEPLKGVGPATASLILAVHDPEHVIFFSDEAYRWLCADGGKSSIKYSIKEFDELHDKAKAIMAKLKVSPIDVEKVAFVIIKENEPVHVPKPKPVPSGRPRGRPPLPEDQKKPVKPSVPGRKRGRPPGTATKEAAPKTPNGTAKRGRPAAAKVEETEATPKSGNKRKADDTPATGRTKKAKA